MGKLTTFAVKAATMPGRYQDGRGLMLFVKQSGARSWVLRLQANGKRRDIGLGSAADVSLAEARAKADDLRRLYRSGADPLAEKRAARIASAALPTFREAAVLAHGEHKAGWRNEKHRADWLSSLERFVFFKLGDIRIDLIDAPMVLDTLLPIWLERPETARRVRQRIKLVFDWSAAKGLRTALDLSGITKALPRQPKTDGHFTAMPYDQVPAFIGWLALARESMSRLALRFLIYTAARSGEVRGATWREVDVAARTWTIPADRMKAGKAHVVPLSSGALTVLKRAAEMGGRDAEPLFPGLKGKPLSDMTMLKILCDRSLPFSVHGFRSSFKTWAVETTNFPDAVSEAALAHIDPNKVHSAYSRTDFRDLHVSLMEAWAEYLAG